MMHCCRYFVSVLLLLLLVWYKPLAKEKESIDHSVIKNPYLIMADSLAKLSRFDDALIYYFVAYEQGMKKDSLFYFWADLFIKRGDFDSALAVNRFALEMNNNEFRKALLKQRYSIYVLLGAYEQALKISEEIDRLNNNTRLFLPFLNFNFSVRFDPEKIQIPDLSFWNQDSSSDYIDYRGSAYFRFNAGLYHRSKNKRKPDFSVGTTCRIKKNSSYLTSKFSAFDSLILEAGGFFSVENIAENLRIELRSTYNSDQAKTPRWISGLSYSYMNSKGNLFSFGGYSIAVHDGIDYQYAYLSAIYDLQYKKIIFSPSFTLSAFGSRNEAIGYPFNDTIVKKIYFDAGSVVQGRKPLFYSDPQLINPLDTSGLNFFTLHEYVTQIQNSSSSVIAVLELPQSYLRIEPSLSSLFYINKKWTLRPSVKLNLDIYGGLYRWTDFTIDEFSAYLAVDKSTENYYQIKGSNSWPDFGIGNVVGGYNSMKRYDTALQGSLAFGYTFKRAGRIIFTLQANKYWTSLPSSCPVVIKPWSFSCYADWYYAFRILRLQERI